MRKLIVFILSARLSAIINIMLAAVLGYHIMQLLLLINNVPLDLSNNRINTSSNTSVNQLQLSKPTLTISALLEAHLLGKNQTVATQIANQTANTPPETKLNLKLHGIYYTSNPLTSFAMIASADGKSAHYRIDQSLPGGAILQQIHPKQVILLRNKRQETLRLVGAQKVLANHLSSNSAKNVQKNISLTNEDLRPEQLLGQYQRQLQTNPNSLIKLMRLSPVSEEGRLVGYRIRPGKEADLLARFNLQAGDVLTAVNDIKLDSPIKGLSVVQQLATASQINLQVLRQGQEVSLSFEVEK